MGVPRWLENAGVWSAYGCIALLALNEESARFVVGLWFASRFIRWANGELRANARHRGIGTSAQAGHSPPETVPASDSGSTSITTLASRENDLA